MAADPTSPGLPHSSLAGIWSGSTSQGEPIRFTVGGPDGALVLASADLDLQTPDTVPSDTLVTCLSSDGRIDLEIGEGLDHAFVGLRFSLRLPDDVPGSELALGDGFMVFEGELLSETQASGTLLAEAPLPFLPSGCVFRGEATWTARLTE